MPLICSSKRRRIRLCSWGTKAKGTFCSCVVCGWPLYNIVESKSDSLARRPVDLFEKEPLKGNSEVHLHTPTKFGEDPSKDLEEDREQIDRQTNAARLIVWCSRHVQNDYSRFFKVYMITFFHYCLSYFHVLPHCDTYYTSRKGDVKLQHLLDLSKLIFLMNRVCMLHIWKILSALQLLLLHVSSTLSTCT